MNNQVMKIDLLKLIKYILKRIWFPILLAAVGFAAMYCYVSFGQMDTYSANATMYVYNGNPNVVNYQYVSSSDLNSAYQLLDTYMVVVKSNKVLETVAERLAPTYQGITTDFIRNTLSMGSVSETGVLKVVCVTSDPQLSADICNAVVDVAPSEIIRVVSAGNVEVIDYAEVPTQPQDRGAMKKGMIGGLAGAVIACGVLLVLFLMNRKVTDKKDIEDAYTPPVLASIRRQKRTDGERSAFLLDSQSPIDILENYAKLRMNALLMMVENECNILAVTSALSGEGKSTITSNLAISCAMDERKVLLIDADLRRACQYEVFGTNKNTPGLTDYLNGEIPLEECIRNSKWKTLDIMYTGHLPPNPTELLGSKRMKELLKTLSGQYDLILMDVPPVNIVTDPLVLAEAVAGCLFVVRQGYSDHREIRNALVSAEMAKMNVLGFVFYGENVQQNGYYSRKYYQKYYKQYDNRDKGTKRGKETGKK